LLIALLLPALSRARESARRTLCLSNLRSVGVAATTAAGDNDGKYPERRRSDPTNPASHLWAPQVAYNGNPATDIRDIWVGYLDGYTVETSTRAFYCPATAEADSLHSFE